jgi:hypothetical protein
MRASPLLAFLIFLVAQPVEASLLEGQSVRVHAEATGVGTYAGPITSVVGAGVEISGGFVNNLNIDYSDTQIRIFSPGGSSPFGGGFTFNGFVFDDVNLTIPAFTSVTIDPSSTLPGFGAAQLSFSADEIRANFNDLDFRTNDQLVLNLNSAVRAVPEPMTLLLLASGLVSLAWATLRSNRHAKESFRNRPSSPHEKVWGRCQPYRVNQPHRVSTFIGTS